MIKFGFNFYFYVCFCCECDVYVEVLIFCVLIFCDIGEWGCKWVEIGFGGGMFGVWSFFV